MYRVNAPDVAFNGPLRLRLRNRNWYKYSITSGINTAGFAIFHAKSKYADEGAKGH